MSRPAWWIARALALAVILLVAACPKSTRRTLVPQVPTTGDAEARQRFLALREEFLRDGGHAQEFTAIADQYAGDPVEPFALLYAGVAAQQAGDAATAATSLKNCWRCPTSRRGCARAASCTWAWRRATSATPTPRYRCWPPASARSRTIASAASGWRRRSTRT